MVLAHGDAAWVCGRTAEQDAHGRRRRLAGLEAKDGDAVLVEERRELVIEAEVVGDEGDGAVASFARVPGQAFTVPAKCCRCALTIAGRAPNAVEVSMETPRPVSSR